MVEGGHRYATGCSALARAPSSIFVNIMINTVAWHNVCLTASPTLRGPSTEVKRVKMAIFFTTCWFATYSTTPTPFDALYGPNGSIQIIDVITEAEDGH